MTAALELRGVGKRYRQFADQELLIKRALRGGRRSGTDLWALRDIDLVAEQGETVGVIGRNGSGKTTLLRMMSGVSAPTVGRLAVHGSIAPLIGVGVGFNPELTGRENVIMNGQLLGLTSREIHGLFDDIVAFSELSRFIDSPVKYYSSGMFLRLAFSVAVHVRPDVLVVDEVLAVGDIAFQQRCNERMREIQRQGTTIVIVTHNLAMLDRIASRTVVLSRGRIVFDGYTTDAIGAYHQVLGEQYDAEESEVADGAPSAGTFGSAQVTLAMRDEHDRELAHLEAGQRFRLRLEARFTREVVCPRVGLMISHELAGPCFSTFSTPVQDGDGRYGPDRPLVANIDLTNRLLGGTYHALATLTTEDGRAVLGQCVPVAIYVSTEGAAHGLVDLEPTIFVGDRPLPDLPSMRWG